jgi:hypothetical protein
LVAEIEIVQHERFSDIYDEPPSVVENVEFRKCEFTRCSLASTFDVNLRSSLRNVAIRDCSVANTRIGAALIDRVVVDGLKTRGLLQLWAAAFRHVTLRGRIGRVIISPDVAPMTASPSQQRTFDEANRRWSRDVDWALDVREAECEELDLWGVPGRLVRLEPRDQVLITREVALKGEWRRLDLSGSWWAVALERLANSSLDSCAVIAPRRHATYKRQVAALRVLRDAGLTEPD